MFIKIAFQTYIRAKVDDEVGVKFELIASSLHFVGESSSRLLSIKILIL